MINTTIAKSEFGSKNQLLLLGERELATGKMFWVVVVQLVPEQRAWLTRGQHPTILFQKPSIIYN